MDASHPEYRAGRRRLKEMLPRARAEVRKNRGVLGLNPTSLLGQSLTDRIEEKNLDSLVVYESGKGKWYADLVMKGLPAGVPNTLGTPMKMPKTSREDAMKEGFSLLTTILLSIEERESASHDTQKKDVRYFDLYGHVFPIDGGIVDQIAELMGEISHVDGGYSIDYALEFLEDSIKGFLDGGAFDSAKFDKSPPTDKAKIFSAMAMMLYFGQFRYPDRKQDS